MSLLGCARACGVPVVVHYVGLWTDAWLGGLQRMGGLVRKAAGSGSERADSCRHVPRMCLPVRGVGEASCGCAEGLRSLSYVRAPIVVDQCIMVARMRGWVQIGAERSGERVRARG
jgi:hypothetical protein